MTVQAIHQIHTAHQWHKTCVTFRTVSRHAGRELTKFKTLDLQDISVKMGGLLQQCIVDAPFPIQKSLLNTILGAVMTLASKSDDINRILSTPANALTPGDIARLLSKIDIHFAAKKISSGAQMAQRTRQFVLDCQKPLANGTLARQAPYITHLPAPKRRPRADINSKNSSKSDFPISPKAAIEAASEVEVRALVESHYGKTIDKILSSCARVLDEHEKLQSILREASANPLNAILATRTLRKFELLTFKKVKLVCNIMLA